MTFRYNRDLANRFVSDLKLPIQNTSEDYFLQHLLLLNPEYKALDKYFDLWVMIDVFFDGDAAKFLKEYYEKRDDIINDILNFNGYKNFLEMDLNKFAVDRNLYNNVTSNNIYNMNNVGGVFVSIDLSKANFQALKHIDALPHNSDTYEDFIGEYTDLDYIKNSKYTRQVIFGKLNPKRQITVEKYLLSKLYIQLIESDEYKTDLGKNLKLVSSSNDELVFEVVNFGETFFPVTFRDTLNDILGRNPMGIQFKVEVFRLEGLALKSLKTKDCRDMMFKKINLIDNKSTLMCVPSYYFPLVYAHDRGVEIKEFMYHFTFEGMDCKINEEFELIRYGI